ncbi:MAG: endonuclease/exonuclease/phosphatase family protein [Burkholderiales bacterium]
MPPDGDTPAALPLRVATWNIHSGIGRDRRYDAARIIAVLRELRADVIALQEVASLAEHGEFLTEVRAALGMSIAAGPTHREGEYGNALLSRYPQTDVRRLDLAWRRTEPRGAIDATLDIGGRTVRVMTTHLGLRPAERRDQVRRLLAAIDAGTPSPLILMGDVNEWFLWGRPARWLHRDFHARPAPATFPAWRPLLALDRIWVRPMRLLRHLAPHATPLARVASDHLPLVADLVL